MRLLDLEFKHLLNSVLKSAEEYFRDEIKIGSVAAFPSWAKSLYKRLYAEYGEDISILIPEIMGLPDSVRETFQAYVLWNRVHQAQEDAAVGIGIPGGDMPENTEAPATEEQGQEPSSVFDKLLSKLLGEDKLPGESNALLMSDIRNYYEAHPGASPEEIYEWLIDPTRDDHWTESYLLEQFGFDKETILEFIRRVISEL